MSINDYIRSYYLFLKFHISGFLRYRKTYKNYFEVIRKILKNKFPIHATLFNGKQMILENRFQAKLVSLVQNNDIAIENKLLIIRKREFPKEIKLCDWENNGDPLGVYFDDAYKTLNVKDKIVIDIGANIGDSAIYFALRGAKKVIALEPFAKNYDSAKKNVELNNLYDKIDLLLAGCSKENGFVMLDDEGGGAGCSIKSQSKSADGIKIPLMTLEDIVKSYDTKTLVLKMDCEGCEYETILNATDKILQKFSQIQIEYHLGYNNLKKKLERCHFRVSVSRPMLWRTSSLLGHSRAYVGYIYAEATSKDKENSILQNFS